VPTPDFSAIPEALRSRPQWLCWCLEQKAGAKKPAKMPYYASGKRRTGVQGSDEDRAALVTFDLAVAAMASTKASGIGFAFLPDDGLIGIDLDKMVDEETGELSPRAQKIIEACASYTEWSPSGNGFHIYVLGTTETTKDNGIGVEMFCSKQFFTVTGRHLAGTPDQVTALDAAVLRRLRKTIDAAKGGFTDKPAPAPKPLPASGAVGERERVIDALNSINPGIGYDDWYQIGMAVQSALGPDGLSVWEAWSARSDKYPGEHVLAQHWRSFKPGRVGAGTLFYHAKAAGWKPPRGWKSKPFLPPPEAPAGEASTLANAPAGSLGNPFWRRGLWRSEAGNAKPVRENVVHMLMEHPTLAKLAGYNVFANRIELLRVPPWGGVVGEWKPKDTSELADWLANETGMLLKLRDVSDAVATAAWRNYMNPVMEQLDALPVWDGTDRLDYWLIECMGALDKPYHRLVGRKYLMGLVKRVLQPGCKFDYMLIFEGPQGRGKSSAFRVLAMRDEWFNDTPFQANLDKDARMALHGCLVYEISEMHSFNQADHRAVKAFISQMDDKLRAPYAEQFETFKRTLVFGGTTNETEYFRDTTGNRRFWPVAIREADLDRLRDWLPQLYAEALHRVKAGESVFPSRQEENDLCQPEQKARLIAHPWVDFIAMWLGKAENALATFVSYPEIFEHCIKLEPARIDHLGNAQKYIRAAMDSLGWFPDRDRVGGVLVRGFRKLSTQEGTVDDAADLPI
jgi:predicted P-loop ATPase